VPAVRQKLHLSSCADFWGRLSGLIGTDLSGADLTDADLRFTNRVDAILNNETILPDGSRWAPGKQLLPSQPGHKPGVVGKIFISYRREDSKWQAGPIYDSFCRALSRERVFIDIDSIPLGLDFHKILKDEVNKCAVQLALIGPAWIDATDPKTGHRRLDDPDDFVRIEIAAALARGIPVVPVLIERAPMPDIDLLPDDLKKLRDRQAEFIEFRTFTHDVERLIMRVLRDLKSVP